MNRMKRVRVRSYEKQSGTIVRRHTRKILKKQQPNRKQKHQKIYEHEQRYIRLYMQVPRPSSGYHADLSTREGQEARRSFFSSTYCRNCGEKGQIGWISTKKYNEKIKEGFKNLKNRRKVENPRPLKKWEPGDEEPWPHVFDSEIHMGEDCWDSGLEDEK